MFTHHSHSGQFCTHATSTLDEVVRAAIARGMRSIALTEHMPRTEADHYAGEAAHPLLQQHGDLAAVFAAYHAEAVRLRDLYAHRIQVLVGFESEWIRPGTAPLIAGLRDRYAFDLFVGSVHHVHAIPIDFDAHTYALARGKAGGTDAALAADYFDSQRDMLEALRPPVVGHFDLIRLMADEANRDRDWRTVDGGRVWDSIVRNLEVVKGYGGVLEVNSAALRKGLADVYPRKEIMEAWTAMGGRLALSDDSHGVGHLCTHYNEALECVARAGVTELWWFAKKDSQAGEWQAIATAEVKASLQRS